MEFIEEINKVFSEYLHDSVEIINKRIDPDEHSLAKKELDDVVFKEYIASVFSIGITLREIAADNLMGIQRLLCNPVMTFAPFVLFRSLVEVSALSKWFMATSIDLRERVGRYFSYKNYSLTEEVKWLRSLGEDSKSTSILMKIEDVKKCAQDLGIEIIRMPLKTYLIKDMLDAESTYRLFSAIAHGQHWAFLRSSFKAVKTESEIYDGIKGGFLEKDIEPIGILYLCLFSLTYLINAETEQFKYYGWDEKPLTQLLFRATDQLKNITKNFNISVN